MSISFIHVNINFYLANMQNVSFDESLNTHSNGTEDLVNFWDNVFNKVELLSRFNFHTPCTAPTPFRAFHLSFRFIGSKKAAAGICGWPQCELGLFLRITQLWDRKRHE